MSSPNPDRSVSILNSPSRLFLRLLWLGPVVMFAGISLTMPTMWLLGQVFEFSPNLNLVAIVTAIVLGIGFIPYTWQALSSATGEKLNQGGH